MEQSSFHWGRWNGRTEGGGTIGQLERGSERKPELFGPGTGIDAFGHVGRCPRHHAGPGRKLSLPNQRPS